MPTKLKKPITITITHVENAIDHLIRCDSGTPVISERHLAMNLAANNGEMWNQIEAGLSAQGINWRTWEPPQPFKIGSHETTFNPNGSIKVGCTDIDRATLVEVLKRSDEAMWPKWFKCPSGEVMRCNDESHAGTYFVSERGEYESGCSTSGFKWSTNKNYQQLSRAEASAILGRDV